MGFVPLLSCGMLGDRSGVPTGKPSRGAARGTRDQDSAEPEAGHGANRRTVWRRTTNELGVLRCSRLACAPLLAWGAQWTRDKSRTDPGVSTYAALPLAAGKVLDAAAGMRTRVGRVASPPPFYEAEWHVSDSECQSGKPQGLAGGIGRRQTRRSILRAAETGPATDRHEAGRWTGRLL